MTKTAKQRSLAAMAEALFLNSLLHKKIQKNVSIYLETSQVTAALLFQQAFTGLVRNQFTSGNYLTVSHCYKVTMGV